jgi:NADPH:quinone reductase-like Zn-dependent oxidoreductase
MWVYRVKEFGSPIGICRDEVSDPPAPGAHEIVVRLEASSLNYRDTYLLRNYSPERTLGARPDMVPLSDGAGEVVATGVKVTRVVVGTKVAKTFFPRWIAGPYRSAYFSESEGRPIDGMLSEYVVLDEDAVVSIPAGLSALEAATLPVAALTAWTALVEPYSLRPGETVLTLGGGGVSVFAVQLAKLFGARVIATTSSEVKTSRLRLLGADHVVNYTAVTEWDREVLNLTDGRGADRVVEIGGPGTLMRSIRSLAVGGHLALVGILARDPTAFDPMELVNKHATFGHVTVGSRDAFEDMIRAIQLQELHPVIDQIFPVSEVRDAYRYMEGGTHVGKIVLDHTS